MKRVTTKEFRALLEALYLIYFLKQRSKKRTEINPHQ